MDRDVRGPEQYKALGQALQKIEADASCKPARSPRSSSSSGPAVAPHEILTAELAWVQPAALLSPAFDLETLADPEVYTCLAPRIELPRSKEAATSPKTREVRSDN